VLFGLTNEWTKVADIGLTLNHVSDRKAYRACSSNCHIKSGLLKVTGRYIHCKSSNISENGAKYRHSYYRSLTGSGIRRGLLNCAISGDLAV